MAYLEKEVFEIVKSALNQTMYRNALSDEKEIYKIIFENGLNGLAYRAIEEISVSDNFYKRLQTTFFEYVAKDQKQLAAISDIKKILNQSQIDYIFMKGSILKDIYPESYMRAMGDIDLLIREHDLEKVHQVFLEHKIKCTFKSKLHDGFMYHDLVIEVHPGLYKDFNPKYESLFKNPWNYSKNKENHEYRFTHEYELCYLLYHLAKHMDSSGVGLRSVLDIGIYARHYEDDIDFEVLHQLLEKGNMVKFYHVMMEFNLRCFDVGFKNHEITYYLSEDEMERLISYISKSGIHGLGTNYNPFSTRVASHKIKDQSKLKFVISLFFPNYESMKGIYPWASKAKILIIPAWIARWFKLIFKKTNSSFRKLKKLKTPEKEIKESINIFEMIGLK